MSSLDPEVLNIGGLVVFLEKIPKDSHFSVRDGGKQETWTGEQVREYLIERVKELAPKITKAGFRAVEVGSIAWFYFRNKRGRFVPINTMFLMRLLYRVPKRGDASG
jgi:hypothetical protein